MTFRDACNAARSMALFLPSPLREQLLAAQELATRCPMVDCSDVFCEGISRLHDMAKEAASNDEIESVVARLVQDVEIASTPSK